jgi:hypothetical protein
MVGESFYWKREVWRIARDLERRVHQRRWPDASYARVELGVMVGFYMIRKMAEAHKISDHIMSRSLRLQVHRPTGKRITSRNTHKVDDLYDLDHSRSETRTVTFACNQIIHSFVFTLVREGDGGFGGIFFASDRQRSRGLFYLDAKDIILTFKDVARDDPAQRHWNIDAATGEERFTVG